MTTLTPHFPGTALESDESCVLLFTSQSTDGESVYDVYVQRRDDHPAGHLLACVFSSEPGDYTTRGFRFIGDDLSEATDAQDRMAIFAKAMYEMQAVA